MFKKLKINSSSILLTLGALAFGLFCIEAYAATGTVKTVGQVALDVTQNIRGIVTLLKAASYIGGFGLILAGILKFKAHKDSPTQVPLSQPIVLISVGAALVLLGGSVDTLTQTLLGETTTETAVFKQTK